MKTRYKHRPVHGSLVKHRSAVRVCSTRFTTHIRVCLYINHWLKLGENRYNLNEHLSNDWFSFPTVRLVWRGVRNSRLVRTRKEVDGWNFYKNKSHDISISSARVSRWLRRWNFWKFTRKKKGIGWKVWIEPRSSGVFMRKEDGQYRETLFIWNLNELNKRGKKDAPLIRFATLLWILTCFVQNNVIFSDRSCTRKLYWTKTCIVGTFFRRINFHSRFSKVYVPTVNKSLKISKLFEKLWK